MNQYNKFTVKFNFFVTRSSVLAKKHQVSRDVDESSVKHPLKSWEGADVLIAEDMSIVPSLTFCQINSLQDLTTHTFFLSNIH